MDTAADVRSPPSIPSLRLTYWCSCSENRLSRHPNFNTNNQPLDEVPRCIVAESTRAFDLASTLCVTNNFRPGVVSLHQTIFPAVSKICPSETLSG